MILTCRCGPAIEVMHSQAGYIFARLFRSFQQKSGGWVEGPAGEERQRVSLLCYRCDSRLEYYETRPRMPPVPWTVGAWNWLPWPSSRR